MAIWDFSHFTHAELTDIDYYIRKLEEYGIYQDEDMIRELNAEIERAEAELCNCGAVCPSEDGKYCENCGKDLG